MLCLRAGCVTDSNTRSLYNAFNNVLLHSTSTLVRLRREQKLQLLGIRKMPAVRTPRRNGQAQRDVGGSWNGTLRNGRGQSAPGNLTSDAPADAGDGGGSTGRGNGGGQSSGNGADDQSAPFTTVGRGGRAAGPNTTRTGRFAEFDNKGKRLCVCNTSRNRSDFSRGDVWEVPYHL